MRVGECYPSDPARARAPRSKWPNMGPVGRRVADGGGAQMFDPYLPLLWFGAITAIMGGVALGLSRHLGPRRLTASKLDAFETGNPPVGNPRAQSPARFYLVALLFLLFDIEMVFIFPWATLYREHIDLGMGSFFFVEMLVFIGTLGLGLAYVWRKGALEWD